MAFGLTEPNHGSDATWLETRAEPDGDGWVINGAKRFNTGVHRATHDLVFARTSGEPGQARGITAFLVPTDTPGLHGAVLLVDVQHADRPRRGRAARTSACPATRCSARWTAAWKLARPSCTRTGFGRRPAAWAPRSTASTARSHTPTSASVFGKPLSVNQAVQWPLVELQTEAQMVRLLVRYAATQLDRNHHMEVSDKVSMANYRANRLVCEAADRAMQVFGGVGYSRHEPFEHIYRHHRRYRITEGAEEIQIRRVAQRLFGFGKRK